MLNRPVTTSMLAAFITVTCGNGSRPIAFPEESTPRAAASQTLCGRRADESIVEVRWRYGRNNSVCDELETAWRNVPHEDRVCEIDEDCALAVGSDGCKPEPLNRKAAHKPDYRVQACGNPAAGVCIPRRVASRCISGCCQL